MIDPAIGMKAGECDIIESLELTRHFSGFFLDGKYYLGAELMTAIGWLEGEHFYYDELHPLVSQYSPIDSPALYKTSPSLLQTVRVYL